MQIFELHFNPKIKEDRFFDSFVYLPENSLEKNLGALYILGEITNAIPANSSFLKNLSETIKKSYYSVSLRSPDKSLRESLKKGNEFLSEEVKKDNTSWLGNLNFAVLSLKDYNLSFSCTGNIKILLMRGGTINEISKNLKTDEIEPYPLKIFFNIVSGQLIENDIILVLTKDIFNLFKEKGILQKISQAEQLNEKSLKEIIPSNLIDKEENAVGACLIIALKKSKKELSPYLIGKKAQEIIFKKGRETTFASFVKKIKKEKDKIKKWKEKFLGKTKKILFWKKETSSSKKTSKPKSKSGSNKKQVPGADFLAFFQNLGKLFKKINLKKEQRKKTIISFLVLFFILFSGYYLFQKNEADKKEEIINSLQKIEEKIKEAEIFINEDKKEPAADILKKAWEEISFIENKKNNFSSEKIDSIKQLLEEKLLPLYSMERIKNPEIILEINLEEAGFIPQNLLFSNFSLWLSSPVSKKIYYFNSLTKKEEITEINGLPELTSDNSDSLLFFSPPNKIISLKENDLKEREITLPPKNAVFYVFETYFSNLYFINGKSEIIKYARLNNNKSWDEPKVIFQTRKKPKSMAINGSIWILNNDNSIDVYYKGKLKKTIALDIFPKISNITKIKTKPDFSSVYLLEPLNSRLIIINKKGELIKQIKSEEFKNLKDFSVSSDEKTIYFLNGNKVYKIRNNK